ncbi:hypothetical protein PC9H_000975 [Pleurotus ostreatus]|uniref:LIM zinc-binding domain-containing protein n=1 Tax=Pleurotus ostreatus TaxID=5322 RepID=A0A8H7DVS7_PLEOS|nr:uncharacterized protein PC9H_000975 [Pleurotus ostreatus]KAF7440629.1 hypothetical protein PC9H_000975 [Pleurotus ostreatus]
MMAPLLSPSSASSQQVPRISQLLPTVKCSSCNNPVPLAELGDHICPKPPPLPTQSKAALNLPKPALTPSAATALLPTRLQNLVSNPRSPSPASSVSSSSPSVAFPQRRDSPRINTNTATSPPRNGPFRGSPSAGSPLENMRARTPSNNSPLAMSPGHDGRARTFSNISNNSLPRPNPNARARTPSDQSSRPSMDARARTPSNNAQPFASSSNYGGPPPMMQPPNPRFQGPPPASYTPPPMVEPPAVPEVIDTKSGGEAGMAGVGRRGFAAAARAAMFALPPPNQRGDGGGGWDDGRSTPFRQNGPEYLNAQPSGYTGPRAGVGAPSPNAPYSPLVTPYAPQTRTPSPMSIPTSNIPPSIPPLNTTFANLSTSPTSNSSNPSSAGPITPLGNARLPFFEKYKKGQPSTQDNEILYDSNNRNLDNPASSPSKTSTPPKRSHSATPSITNGLPTSPAAARSASSASSYSARTGRQRSNTTTTTASDTKSPSIPVPMSPSSGSEYGLAYADSDAEDEDKGLLPFPGTIKKSPTSSPRKGSILRSGPQRDASRNHIRFPSMTTDSSGSLPQTAALKPGAQKRRERMSTNSNSVYSDSDDDDSVDERALRDSPKSSKGLSLLDRVANSHATARGGADLEVVMETLIEDLSSGKDYEDPEMRPLDKGRTFPTRSNTVPGGSLLPQSSPESKNPPPPTTIVRSRTTPGSGLSAHDHDLNAKVPEKSVKPKKIRVCRKCDKQIDDGRWIAIDGGGGGVLCEACWKNMYLPKCRRCNLPIETAAISSSDGQLKGKYHKQCFSCSTCQKPFPDKTFYVFDGKPFCAYHYHEANDSLCAAALCGQPIEGPCAVSHSGDRYHPEHFTCEHPGYPCKTRLEEYWEVDGRMLCDKHVHAARSTYDGDSDYGDDVGAQDLVMSGRAMKRVTRFIDLGEGGLR